MKIRPSTAHLFTVCGSLDGPLRKSRAAVPGAARRQATPPPPTPSPAKRGVVKLGSRCGRRGLQNWLGRPGPYSIHTAAVQNEALLILRTRPLSELPSPTGCPIP